ncbi:MAG: hypothetical protein ACJAWQ_001851 [Paraglaciecola sp.]|jgi:hypothetical protein
MGKLMPLVRFNFTIFKWLYKFYPKPCSSGMLSVAGKADEQTFAGTGVLKQIKCFF